MNTDYKIILKAVREEFGERVFYFNEKRKSFRRVKIPTRYRSFTNARVTEFLMTRFADKIMEIGVTDNRGSHCDGVYFKLPL